MVVISEISDDGSNGGVHQNKKPKEEENQNKKLKEKVGVSLGIRRSHPNLLPTLPIPDDLILSCLLLVRRCHHPSLSLVCSSFRRLMPKLYDERLRLGYTESVLYAYVGFPPVENPTLYILQCKPYRNLKNTVSLRLCKIDTLPPIPWGSTVVTIRSDIYVIGGGVGESFPYGGSEGQKLISDVTFIDCKFHKFRSLPSMNVGRCRAAAGVIDGKIYVIGGRLLRPWASDLVEVFDLEEQSWSSIPAAGPYPRVYGSGEFLTYAVMNEKIYCLDIYRTAHIYDPKDGKWTSWDWPPELLNALWQESSCVIDNFLFSINPVVLFNGFPVNVYDPELKSWFPLEGLQGFPDNILRDECKMANFGGKLVILGADGARDIKYDGEKREIWYVEISWERKEDGAFWGNVESVEVVLTPPKTSSVELFHAVTV